jgi:hypothetical protein
MVKVDQGHLNVLTPLGANKQASKPRGQACQRGRSAQVLVYADTDPVTGKARYVN